MRGCLCSYDRVPVEPGSNVALDPKAAGPFLLRSLFLLPFTPVTRGVPELVVQICPTILSREALQKRLPFPDFRLIVLLLFKSFIKFSLHAKPVSILVFVTHPVLDYHVVALYPDYPPTNIALVHRLRLQTG